MRHIKLFTETKTNGRGPIATSQDFFFFVFSVEYSLEVALIFGKCATAEDAMGPGK